MKEARIEKMVNLIDMKEGDIFSFRTFRKPIWWRFVSYNDGKLVYEEIKNHYQHTAFRLDLTVLQKL